MAKLHEDSKFYCVNSPGFQDIEMSTDDNSTLPTTHPTLFPPTKPSYVPLVILQ